MASSIRPLGEKNWCERYNLVGRLKGSGKGAMAAWMVACDTIRRSGTKLAGDILLTMVVGEIGLEPIDEYAAPAYLAKEAGVCCEAVHLDCRGSLRPVGLREEASHAV